MVNRTWLGLAAFLALCAVALPVLAVDNPDAPDLAAEFEARAKPLEDRIGEAAGGVQNLGSTIAEYDVFLDRELNGTYAALIARLAPARRTDLQHAQRRWLAWRDAEIEFINRQWVLASAGSSSTLTRSNYRSGLTKQRTLELLHYLQELPAPATR